MLSDNRPLENFLKKIVPKHLNRSQLQYRFDDGRRDNSPPAFLSPVLRLPYPWPPSGIFLIGGYSGAATVGRTMTGGRTSRRRRAGPWQTRPLTGYNTSSGSPDR
jgi:hypothetical protein